MKRVKIIQHKATYLGKARRCTSKIIQRWSGLRSNANPLYQFLYSPSRYKTESCLESSVTYFGYFYKHSMCLDKIQQLTKLVF